MTAQMVQDISIMSEAQNSMPTGFGLSQGFPQGFPGTAGRSPNGSMKLTPPNLVKSHLLKRIWKPFAFILTELEMSILQDKQLWLCTDQDLGHTLALNLQPKDTM